MPLFQVPGWTVPESKPVTSDSPSSSKKRKRHSTDEGSHSKLGSAQINFETLVNKLSGSGSAGSLDNENKQNASSSSSKDNTQETKKKMSKADKKKASISGPMKLGHTSKRPASIDEQKPPSSERNKIKGKEKEGLDRIVSVASTVSQRPQKRVKWDGSVDKGLPKPDEKKKSKEERPVSVDTGLTKLQREMKESLDGARFRQINEQLYKSGSAASHELLKADPQIFHDYHTGFRHQVQSWPTNPVDVYTSSLASYPPKTLIADLGCGDAQLARTLNAKGLNVLSFDLVGSSYVIEADTCERVPLPGSAPDEGESGGGAAVVDVVVCALALMGTNWVGCIREAWRILRDGGELKIAEVASRFTDMREFIDVIKSVGFKLVSKDESNTHFVMLEFVKDAKKAKVKTEHDITALMKRGSTLKACEYKKR